MEGKSYDDKLLAEPVLHRVLEDLAAIHGEAERYRGDLILRKQELFDTLEGDGRYFAGNGGIDATDAAPIGSMLDAIGKTPRLDLLLNSPGGYGEAVEKLVHMCRSHTAEEFRVIVPNAAKSAATLTALAADVVLMGYPSELGPIDPQYEISIGNVVQQLSGYVFIHAFDTAQSKAEESMAKGESPLVHLQTLQATTMEPAFIEHCRRGVDFSRDIATRFLSEYQLPAKLANAAKKPSKATIKRRAERAAENLLSENARFSHGRLIGAVEARDDVGLNVVELDREDTMWRAYWELYVRAEVYMQTIGREVRIAKLFVERSSTLPAFG